MNEFINKYKNAKFGTLTVVGPEEYVMDQNDNIIQKNVYCHCDCGKQWIIAGISDLLNGLTTSCGCEGPDTFVRVVNSGHMGHGDSKGGPYHDLYLSWKQTRTRINFSNRHKNTNIIFYEEWNDYLKFKEWALANGWCNYMRLSTSDKNNYNPDNCYWSY